MARRPHASRIPFTPGAGVDAQLPADRVLQARHQRRAGRHHRASGARKRDVGVQRPPGSQRRARRRFRRRRGHDVRGRAARRVRQGEGLARANRDGGVLADLDGPDQSVPPLGRVRSLAGADRPAGCGDPAAPGRAARVRRRRPDAASDPGIGDAHVGPGRDARDARGERVRRGGTRDLRHRRRRHARGIRSDLAQRGSNRGRDPVGAGARSRYRDQCERRVR